MPDDNGLVQVGTKNFHPVGKLLGILYGIQCLFQIFVATKNGVQVNEVVLSVGVAEAIGISPSYLSKQFKEDLGIGFADYLCNYRIEKAMSMLKESNVSNKDISQMCGFSQKNYGNDP